MYSSAATQDDHKVNQTCTCGPFGCMTSTWELQVCPNGGRLRRSKGSFSGRSRAGRRGGVNVTMRKLTLAIIFSICMALGVASCGSSGDSTAESLGCTSSGIPAPAPFQSEFTQIATQCYGYITKIVITNVTDWVVFYFSEAPNARFNMTVTPPPNSSDDLTQQTENATFSPGTFSGAVNLPPGDTLTVAAPYSGLMVHMNLAGTRNQTIINGLAEAFKSILPEGPEQRYSEAADDVAQCVQGATELPSMTTAGTTISTTFWDEVPHAESCHSAYSLFRDAADDSGQESESASEVAKEFTGSFFEEILPKLGKLLSVVSDHS